MSDEAGYVIENRAAHEAEEKFHLYFVSLVFTLLAASIQTAKFGIHRGADAFELAGWVLLLGCGLFSLSYLEWRPMLRKKMAQQSQLEATISSFKSQMTSPDQEIHFLADDSKVRVGEYVEKVSKTLKTVNSLVSENDKRIRRRYSGAKYTFLAGIVALLVSRAWPAAAGLTSMAF